MTSQGGGGPGPGGGLGPAEAGCGHPVRPGARFCTVCGRPVAQDNPRAVPADEPGLGPEPEGDWFRPAPRPERPGEPDQPTQQGWADQPAQQGWPVQPAQQDWPHQPAQQGWPHQPAQQGWPDQPSPQGWADQPAQQDWPHQTAQQGWPDQSAQQGWPGPAAQQWPGADAQPGWTAPATQQEWLAPAAEQGWPGAHQGWPPGAGATPGAQQPPTGPRRRGSRWPLALIAVVLVAGGIAAVVVLLLHPFGHAQPTANTGPAGHHPSRPPTPGATATASPGQSAEQTVARGLAGLLSQSVSDRSAVVRAVNDVSSCGPNLSQDVRTFDSAASSRQSLLTRLASLPDGSALPAGMLHTLTGAWQASAQADQDFARWAQDEMSKGCTRNDHADPGYRAAAGPDARATADKQAFANLWNPLAAKYGLATYQWNQL